MCEECFMDCVEMENEWATFLDLKKQLKLIILPMSKS
jgi:hypothetical protein